MINNMWRAAKGIFSSDKLVENVSAGIDKSFYTAEEKAEGFHVLLKLYEPFKLAQRYLMIIFCVPYAIAFLTTFFASFFIDVTSQKAMLQGDISIIVGIIVTFYFGGGAVEGVIGSRKKDG
jgi:hypothetical protein